MEFTTRQALNSNTAFPVVQLPGGWPRAVGLVSGLC